MRVAIAEIKQESNTFSTVPTTLEHFRDFHLWYGADVLTNLRGTNTEVGGFIDVCDEMSYTILPLLAGFAISGAPLTTETYSILRDELLRQLDRSHPLDAVLLALHGAMVSEDEDDADGATLQAVRELIGPNIPLVVSMDLHANITGRCIEHADVIVGFRTSPHIDQRETGRRAARILSRWLRRKIRPAMACAKIPMVVPASTHVDFMDGPFKQLIDASVAAETDNVLTVSVFSVQPWLDIPEMGFAIVVVSNNNPSLAERIACRLGNLAWMLRHAFLDIQLVSPARAIQDALAISNGPVILSDVADGTGAGSPGDGTAIIAALVEAKPQKPVLAYICDAEVVSAAARIGVGGQIDVFVGAKRDNVYNSPVQFAGTIEFAQPASYQFTGQGYKGITMNMGLSAVLRQDNIHLLVTSNPVMTVDPALYRAVGLEPSNAHIVVVKSHIQFRAGYADIAQEIILLDTPGMSSDHLTSLNYRHVDRPLFPLDTNFEYVCESVSRSS